MTKPQEDVTASALLGVRALEVLSRISDDDAQVLTAWRNEFAQKEVSHFSAKRNLKYIGAGIFCVALGLFSGLAAFNVESTDLAKEHRLKYEAEYEKLVAAYKSPPACIPAEPIQMSWAHTSTVDRVPVYYANTDTHVCLSFIDTVTCLPRPKELPDENLQPILQSPE